MKDSARVAASSSGPNASTAAVDPPTSFEAIAEEVGEWAAERFSKLEQKITLLLAEARTEIANLKSEIVALKGHVQGQVTEFNLSNKRDLDREREELRFELQRFRTFEQPAAGEQGVSVTISADLSGVPVTKSRRTKMASREPTSGEMMSC